MVPRTKLARLRNRRLEEDAREPLAAIHCRGYSTGGTNFDAVILGHIVDGKLVYVARTRSGFTPAVRAELLRNMKPLEMGECPFCNLPEKRPRRWGEGLTADKMNECRWLRPELTVRVEFLEWVEDRHLRHSRFVGM